MPTFSVIIPTCNKPGRPEGCLERAIDSIKCQTWIHWKIFVVHDGPNDLEDGVMRIDRSMDDKIIHIRLPENRHAGGARNAAMDLVPLTNFVIFLDDDDYLCDKDVMFNMAGAMINFADANRDWPDMIRGGYIKHFVESGREKVRLIEDGSIEDATKSPVVSPCAKIVRADNLVRFPEGVKHQDVVQHIAQCDKCNTYLNLNFPIFTYSIYDRPDKAKDSEESKKVLATVPQLLRSGADRYRREVSKEAALKWADKIERMYT